ncbi:M15 family metallopeptidase [Aliivibrio kagoshimensis]|uniref:M15 family metallopeptidase n=1 Tax=Aliivibrio kagoshimensis TaxID=2910230 RepID=UPI003D0F19FF
MTTNLITSAQLSGHNRGHLTPLRCTPSRLLHTHVHPPFIELKAAAKQAGFDLMIASSFRDFERQQQIWNNKYLGHSPILDAQSQPIAIDTLSDIEKIDAILRWSALPGASRHHWGTDLDLYAGNTLPKGTSLQLEPWEYQTGHQAEFSQWLSENIDSFGFFLPYHHHQQGVAQEPWHVSYYPLSAPFLNLLTIERLESTIISSQIAGKESVLSNLERIYTQYVLNICHR